MIEWLKPSDFNEIVEVHQLIYEQIENPWFYNWDKAGFLKELNLSKTLVFKDQAQKIIGFILFREVVDQLEIMVLGTHVHFRQKNTMGQLILYLQEYAAQQDKEISLEVHEHNNSAKSIYTKYLFVLRHVRKNYYRDGGSACIYTWKKSA